MDVAWVAKDRQKGDKSLSIKRLNEDRSPGAGSPALVKFFEGEEKECCLTVHDNLLLSVGYLNPKLVALKQSVKCSAHLALLLSNALRIMITIFSGLVLF